LRKKYLAIQYLNTSRWSRRNSVRRRRGGLACPRRISW
jgi:hypothetical protein